MRMTEDTRTILQAMRAASWARAKGELNAILTTYYDDIDNYTSIDKEIKGFISHIEENAIGGFT